MSLWSSIRTSLISKQLLRNYIDQFESLWTNLIIGIKLRDQNSYFVKEKKWNKLEILLHAIRYGCCSTLSRLRRIKGGFRSDRPASGAAGPPRRSEPGAGNPGVGCRWRPSASRLVTRGWLWLNLIGSDRSGAGWG